jgi:hypothetical protein
MPTISNFTWTRFDDGSLVINLDPPTAIGGQNLAFTLGRYFGGAMDTIVKTAASGFNGVSGLTVVNSGQGQMSVALTALDTSGLDFGNWAYRVARTTSGQVVAFTEGFCLLQP